MHVKTDNLKIITMQNREKQHCQYYSKIPKKVRYNKDIIFHSLKTESVEESLSATKTLEGFYKSL